MPQRNRHPPNARPAASGQLQVAEERGKHMTDIKHDPTEVIAQVEAETP